MWQSVDSGYSKVLHITKAGGFQKGSKVSFTLDGAQNYTGKALASYNSGELTVSARPAEIVLNALFWRKPVRRREFQYG